MLAKNTGDETSNGYTEYRYTGTSIQEITHGQIGDVSITSNRIIDPDGSYRMTVSDGTKTNTMTGYVDYDMFKMIADAYISQSSAVMPLGSDVTGSQYKHVYVGTPGPVTITKDDLDTIKDAMDAYSLLTLVLPLPGSALLNLADLLLLVIDNNSPYRVVINSTTYEVVSSYDNSYFFHCYHQVIRSYNSSGRLLSTEYDYVQAIGG